ncbi:ABC transporter family substrate-binding protein [Cellulomonas composti]|uniref:Peptide ABC transporter substrate-binding protein n=1 Tax=Cellulomonas composti TaxID=266130 RepID=A0A511JA63_9CELL|nr:ABC transporter family substrate-binding protein [Cellulomonas composti]GEL94885.1 peptide ABC transporter substrate-binding protein [Cellulomonas composti]
MKIRRSIAGVAFVASAALILTACSNAPEDSDETTAPTAEPTEAATGGTLTVAETNQFFSFNSNTSNGNVDINAKVTQYPTRAWFNYVDGSSFAAGNPGVAKDESFGTYEVVSEDPLTVKYTINEGVVWSDGEPVDEDDLLLSWAVDSGHYNSTDGSVSYFDYAGDTGTLGLTDFPEFGDDGRSMTVTYSSPAADWEYALAAEVPAHVVAKGAGLADGQALIDLFTKLADTAPTATAADPDLQKVADFWNTGFDSTILPSDPSLYLSSGPYIISDVVENQSVTLVPNEKYAGDLTAKLDSIVMRTIPDATAAVQALQNGEVDVISPQSSADTLTALDALSGVTVHKGDQLAYDHVDLTFNNGGPFDPATYGGDEAKALKVRQAFLKVIPRQAILDAIIIPQKADASILNSQLFVPAQAAYADSVANNGSDQFPGEPDIEGAKALLAEAGVPNPTVRFLYNVNNPNRVNAYTLIAAQATAAGFKVDDQGDAEWGSRLSDGSYDAVVFGWINSGVGVSGVPQIFGSTGGGNYNGFANAQVDELANTLVKTLDPDEQVNLQKQIDPLLFADAYGLPLFQSVGVDAVSDRVGGIADYNPSQSGVWWNVWDWTVNDG